MLQIQQNNQAKPPILRQKGHIYSKGVVQNAGLTENIKALVSRAAPRKPLPLFILDYKKHYRLLIQKARNRTTPDCYTEKHHILPRCIGGADDPENLVSLTGREHFVAHWLLHRMYPEDSKLAFSFQAMTTWSGNSSHSRYTPSSRAVAEAKEAASKAKSLLMTENNPMKRPELKELQRQKNLGENNFYHFLTIESKEKHREGTRASKMGSLNPNATCVEYTPTGAIYGSITECYKAENLKRSYKYLEKHNIIKRL